MKITTDNKWHDFKYRYEVPERVLRSEFDYQDENETVDGYFHYKGSWYHLDMFMRVPSSLSPWEGYQNDSYSTGVVIMVSPNGESYKVGSFMS